MDILIINIGVLAGILPKGTGRLQGKEMSKVETIEDAWLLIRDGKIHSFGQLCRTGGVTEGNSIKKSLIDNLSTDGHFSIGDSLEELRVIDAQGGYVMPCFCDSHSHIVYAGCRDGEYRDKIAGLSYEEIAQRGGGIINSSSLLEKTSEEELYEQAMERVWEMMAKGSGAIEIKSGYGLSTEQELKMLRVIRKIKESSPVTIKSTFLGAHAVGRAFASRKDDYVDYVCEDMIPAVSKEGLADYVDVFCDKGFFTADDTTKILEAAAKFGLVPKIHANELDENSGGVQVAVKFKALSADHLERTGSKEIEALRGSITMPTMLPGTSFFLGIPYGNAKGFINEGLGIALASDYNPGSCPAGDMRFVMALGCIKMRLTPEQSFNACTINAAYAMGVDNELGSITEGKKANLIITRQIPSLAFITYAHQTPFIEKIILNGEVMSK